MNIPELTRNGTRSGGLGGFKNLRNTIIGDGKRNKINKPKKRRKNRNKKSQEPNNKLNYYNYHKVEGEENSDKLKVLFNHMKGLMNQQSGNSQHSKISSVYKDLHKHPLKKRINLQKTYYTPKSNPIR